MLRLLAALSWADGTLAEDERATLERLIEASDLDGDERATARGWLAVQVEIDEAAIDSLSHNQRLATYQAAVRIALSDADLAVEERSFLDRVRDTLGISEDDAAEIEESMPRHD